MRQLNVCVAIQHAIIVRGLNHPCIFYMDMLQKHQADVNVRDRVIDFYHGMIIMPLYVAEDSINALRLSRNIRIPAYAEAMVPVFLRARHILVFQSQRHGLLCISVC